MEKQLLLQTDSNVLVMKYSEIVLQFGYVTMFAPAFPLAPFFSMISNLIEIKTNMNNMAHQSKRYIALGASSIGSWAGIIEVISILTYP